MPLFSQHTPRATVHEAPSPQAAATLLRRYRPLETRATGGFGSVEVCLDSRLQRRVAIKRIPLATEGGIVSANATAAALAEARTASMLAHPHIVSVIDFSYDDSFAYLVMEYVDGLSLEEFLAQVDGHSLTYDEAACIADALTQALSFAHENGVLHLDIKPANVLIDHNGHVRLTDFGMATLASAAGYGGARGGTIGYMAPEQLNGSIVDERSDIFSLAAVLYEALCGEAPFRAATPADSLARIESGVTPPAELLPDIPEGSEHALLAALMPAPEARCRTVEEFADNFLDRLGNARAGKKSLARMIAHMTADDTVAAPDIDEEDPVETDPELGYLGTRYPAARRVLEGALSGVSVAFCSYAIFATMGLSTMPAALAAVAIGAAAGAAAQIGSALVLTGLLFMIVNATPPVSVLPAATLLLAGGISWWLVWGRTDAHASTALVMACAAANLSAGHMEPGLVAAALAGILCTPGTSCPSIAFGMVAGRLLCCAIGNGGALDAGTLGGALANLPFIATTVCASVGTWSLSRLVDRACEHYETSGSPAGLPIVCILPLLAAALALCLGRPMEITSLKPEYVASYAGAGILSSIICWIVLYLFGFKRPIAESDRS